MTAPPANVLSGTGGALLIALLVLLAVAGIVWAVSIIVAHDRQPKLEDALSPYGVGRTTERDAPVVAKNQDLVAIPFMQRAVNSVGEFATRRGLLQYLEGMLRQADLSVRPAEALFLYLAAVAVAVVLALLLGGPFWALGAGAMVVLIPWATLSTLATRRTDKFTAQLPDMLRLLGTTLRSGFSILQGLDTVANQLSDPTRELMRQVVSEVRLGRPLVDALDEVTKETRSQDFAWVVSAIAIQREVGGNLAELLDIVAETMNARARLRREVRTLTAEGRIGALVISLMPIAIGLFVYSINRSYLSPLFHSTPGKYVFFGSIILAVVGILWIRRIVKIEV
jgi:tight adherence protein B